MQQPHFITLLENLFEQVGKEKTLAKGAFLVKEGQVENYLYRIESGAVRVFLLTELEELTVRFGYEGSYINSLSSFLRQTPSEFFIETIRKTTVRYITRQALLDMAFQSPENHKAYTLLLENLISQQIEREIDLLTISPAQRLERVLARSPNLFQQIPMKYIASYLRMTPETLSRIRNS